MLDFLYIYSRYDESTWEPFGSKQALTIAGILGVCLRPIWFSRTRVEFSADNQRYRQYRSLLGLHLGRWQPLPPVVGVTLKHFATEKLLVMLSLQHSRNGLILAHFDADDINAAIDFAHDTAERFHLPVNQYLPPHLYQPLLPDDDSKRT